MCVGSDNYLPSFTKHRLCHENLLTSLTRRVLSILESRYFRHTSISFVFPHQSRVMGLGTDSMLPIYVAPQSSSRAQQDIILFLMIMVNMQSMKVLHYTVIGRKSRNIMAKLRLFYKVYVCAMHIVHIDIILKYRQRQRLLIILKKL